MKTNTVKLSLVTLLVHLMCFSVVLSHMHAKDAASLLSQQSSLSKLSTSDIPAKALGDLHHHIDKTGLKNVTADSSSTTAARTRELDPLSADHSIESLAAWLHDFMLRLRVVSSLCYHYAYA